jgi:hypothetical protein
MTNVSSVISLANVPENENWNSGKMVFARTLYHELIHSTLNQLTGDKLNDAIKLTEGLMAEIDKIKSTLNKSDLEYLNNKLKDINVDGKLIWQELYTYALTDNKFKHTLNKIYISDDYKKVTKTEKNTIWEEILRILSMILGFNSTVKDNSVLEEVINTYLNITDSNPTNTNSSNEKVDIPTNNNSTINEVPSVNRGRFKQFSTYMEDFNIEYDLDNTEEILDDEDRIICRG